LKSETNVQQFKVMVLHYPILSTVFMKIRDGGRGSVSLLA